MNRTEQTTTKTPITMAKIEYPPESTKKTRLLSRALHWFPKQMHLFAMKTESQPNNRKYVERIAIFLPIRCVSVRKTDLTKFREANDLLFFFVCVFV